VSPEEQQTHRPRVGHLAENNGIGKMQIRFDTIEDQSAAWV
jgi:hypothetical protein